MSKIPDDLVAHRGVSLHFEDVEQDREHVLPQIARVLLLDQAAEVGDLGVVEEIQCRVEVLEIDQSRTRFEQRLFGPDRIIRLRWLDRPGLELRRELAHSGWAIFRQLDVFVAEEEEVVLPQHDEEIILVRRVAADALDDVEEGDQIVLLESLLEAAARERPPCRNPRQAIGRLAPFAEHDGAFPDEVGLGHDAV